jgi:hypothetical protein
MLFTEENATDIWGFCHQACEMEISTELGIPFIS